jgi:hypothetical protein
MECQWDFTTYDFHTGFNQLHRYLDISFYYNHDSTNISITPKNKGISLEYLESCAKVN